MFCYGEYFFSMTLFASTFVHRHSILKDYILCAKPSSLVLCAHQKLMLSLFLKCGFCSQLLEAQADYHRKALAVIEKVLPEIQAHQGKVTCALADASPCLCHLCTILSSFILILLHADLLNKAILIYLTILHSQA